MPKNSVNGPITDQEIVFARLVLSGTMTDRQAAEAAGLKPDTAAYTKAKPRVRAYMLEHRAAVEQQFVNQEAEQARRRDLCRERVLTRLWQIADLDTEKTRNSAASQMKALAMIVALEGLLPHRRANAAEKKAAPLPVVNVCKSAWMRAQEEKSTQSTPDANNGETDEVVADVSPQVTDDVPDNVTANVASVEQSSGVPNPPPGAPVNPVPSIPSWPYARVPDAAPDSRRPFRIPVNPFKPRRPYR